MVVLPYAGAPQRALAAGSGDLRAAILDPFHGHTIVYATGRIPWGKILDLVPDGSLAWGRAECQPSGVHVPLWEDGHPGHTTILSAAAWDLPRSPEPAEDRLKELIEACAAAGVKWKPSASGTARWVLSRSLPKDERQQLAPRWRTLADAAITPGPMVVTSGGTRNDCVELDMVQAFAAPLRGPLPSRRSWVAVPAEAADDVAMTHPAGVAYAAVDVPPGVYTLPPLHTHSLTGVTLWPEGTFTGVWSFAELQRAAAMGCTVVRVIAAQMSTGEDYHLCAMMDGLDGVPKVLRKAIYTRAWGLMCSKGTWSGEKFGAAWRWAPPAPLTDRRGGLYRPDIALTVTSTATLSMVTAAQRIPRERFHAAHVDALFSEEGPWIGQIMDAEPGRWAVKGRGRMRIYGLGSYAIGDRRTAGTAGDGSATRIHRHWIDGALPIETELARSEPVLLSDDLDRVREWPWGDVPPLADESWSYQGWQTDGEQKWIL